MDRRHLEPGDRVQQSLTGCDHCYAEAITERFHGRGSFTQLQLHPGRLATPGRWRAPRRVFVNSMSDLFHPTIPQEFLVRVFAVMAATPRHTYQVLTKRHARMRALLTNPEFRHAVLNAARQANPATTTAWPLPNLWVGASVEDHQRAQLRIPALVSTPVVVRFLSCEPLLGPLPELELTGIDWVITGGESGPTYRPLDLDWVRGIRDRCQTTGVAFFFKQLGGRTPKAGGRLLDGRTWDDYPTAGA